MKPTLALLLCCPLIAWLWRLDQRERPRLSSALWLPLCWLLVLGSHQVSWWLGIRMAVGGTPDFPDLEGNFFDRYLCLAEIILAIYIVSKRNIAWGTLISQNKGLVLFYLFLLVTALWAEYPYVVFRRWFKDIGAVFVLLVLLTDEDPMEAIKVTFARCAYVLFPMSVILMKYFPDLGRGYSKGGAPMITGVTDNKNTLGMLILVLSLVLLSALVENYRERPERRLLRGQNLALFVTLAIGLWLLFLADSKTSEVCFVVGSMIVASPRLPLLKRNPKRVLILCCIAIPVLFAADSLFGISDSLFRMLGRNPTLTERTEIWKAIEENPVDPLIGAGYMMYWDLHNGIGTGNSHYEIKAAHNGYLETYLDGGAIGLICFGIMIIAVGARVVREFLKDNEYGRLSLVFLVVMLLHNVSESTFARRSTLWFGFLLFALNFRQVIPPEVDYAESAPLESESEDEVLAECPQT